MSYELTFTRGFKEGLEGLPREIYPIVDRQLDWIQRDPFARNPNATRMKNARHAFRVKIGIHVRLLYQVFSGPRRVLLNAIGPRKDIYGTEIGSSVQLSPDEAEAIRDEIRGINKPTRTAAEPPPEGDAGAEPAVVVEALDWITEDELFLLHVPPESWPALLGAGSVEGLQSLDVEPGIKVQIEDYWTNPEPTQVEKLYALGATDGAEAIARQPLASFLVALDPEQKLALRKIRVNGPYLLKGSAGTGKSLIGLYYIRDLITARAGESLYDGQEALHGVITYTNTLVDANNALLRSISPDSAHAGIRCSTLDKIAYDLAGRALGKKPNALSSDGMAKWIKESIVPRLSPSAADLVLRLGADYVADEFEQSIFANGLATVDEYVELERRGRKRALREPERRELWTAYEAFVRLCEQRGVQTFEQWRLLALRYLVANPDHPRFTALFVDEAQDFSKVARRLCLELVKDPKHLLLAADTAQSIYTVPSSWRQTDPRLNFQRRRPIMLERSYRATKEIGQAIMPLRLDPGDEEDHSDHAKPVFFGPKPRWIDAPLDAQARVVAGEIGKLVRDGRNPINAGQIALIVRDSTRAARFGVALTSNGIESIVVDKQSPLRLSGHQVHIVTAHSSKGLGFPVVFVPEVHSSVYPWSYLMDKTRDEQQREQMFDAEQRVLYVALSRASHRLIMIVDPDRPSRYVDKLDREAHWS